jgi:signal transduction histidine kinase
MISPSVPADEQQRLDALQRLGILDTDPEDRFDRLTRLATSALGVPIALVSLVDANRQWFKSCVGLDVSQTDRNISFCGHAILGPDPLIIPDATADPRFADNPLVTGEPHIRFYAGVPLSDPDGYRLGTLCVIDRRRRQLSESELEVLTRLAALAEAELITMAREELIEQLARANERIHRSEQLHRSVLTAMHSAVMVFDADGGLIAGNRRARDMATMLTGGDLGRLATKVGEIDADRSPVPRARRPLGRLIDRGREITGQRFGLQTGDGELRWLDVHTQRVTDEPHQPPVLVLSVDDVTDRVEIDELKSQFVSLVSHELRTPLTAINGALGLLDNNVTGALPATAAELVKVARSGTGHLLRLVDDLLDLSRMESGADQLEPALGHDEHLLSIVAEMMEPLARNAAVTIEVESAGTTFVADHDRLLQALTNLVGNAIKFSQGGTVWIRSTVDDSSVIIAVTDSGRGIPTTKLETIFEPFQQVESADSRAKGGTGLGLTITRRIVEWHGGTVEVESTLGRGSTFRIILPRSAPGD